MHHGCTAGIDAGGAGINTFFATVVIMHRTFGNAPFTNLFANLTHCPEIIRVPRSHPGRQIAYICAIAANMNDRAKTHVEAIGSTFLACNTAVETGIYDPFNTFHMWQVLEVTKTGYRIGRYLFYLRFFWWCAGKCLFYFVHQPRYGAVHFIGLIINSSIMQK